MKSVYETIADLARKGLDPQYECEHGFARTVLKAIREPAPEILSAIGAKDWRAAIDAALREADRADAAFRAQEIQDFQQSWPRELAAAIAAGAIVRPLVPNGDVLTIDCDGQDYHSPFPWTVVLSSASVTDSNGESVPRFHIGLASIIGVAVSERARRRRENRRRKILREHYRWDRAQRAYVPLSGTGARVKPDEDPPGLD